GALLVSLLGGRPERLQDVVASQVEGRCLLLGREVRGVGGGLRLLNRSLRGGELCVGGSGVARNLLGHRHLGTSGLRRGREHRIEGRRCARWRSTAWRSSWRSGGGGEGGPGGPRGRVGRG